VHIAAPQVYIGRSAGALLNRADVSAKTVQKVFIRVLSSSAAGIDNATV
tara:strand:- start:1329 stop:1475 length:147 start_codon:yes stop_codon:yes gene_type:complete